MKVIEISRAFFDEYGKPMIEREFPDFADRIAAGLVGHGSECFGYDDDLSLDHDVDASFCLWLTENDEREIGFKLFRAYSKLPKEYMGLKIKKQSLNEGSKGIMTISDFYRRYTGKSGAPETLYDWLYTPSHYLAEAVNGEIFCDTLGELTRIRNEIKYGMPEDVRLKKIASCVFHMAQSGQYNYPRCLSHGEGGAARLALGEFVKNSIELVFLLNKAHMPYYKWSFRAMKSLDILGNRSHELEKLLDTPNSGSKEICDTIESFCADIISELARQGMSDLDFSYLEPHAYCINDKIKDNKLRNMSVIL